MSLRRAAHPFQKFSNASVKLERSESIQGISSINTTFFLVGGKDILYDGQTLLDQLEKDKGAFEEVKKASLVHWDMWEGNVFVKDGRVSGIIDWERAMWGEPFMDDRFRMHNRDKNFLEGFGQTSFTENELKRLRWYDIILYLTMMIEVFYREFEDKGQYFWAREMLEKVV